MAEEPRKTEAKPSRMEVARRIDITESLLIDCATVTDTVRYFAEKESLILARRTVERYRTVAEQRIVKAEESIRVNEIRKAKLRFERCFARAISGSKKNVPAAIAAQKGLNALLGLNAPKEMEEVMDVQAFARQVMLEQKEMRLITLGPEMIQHEIIELFKRYKLTGGDWSPLIEEIAKIARTNAAGD